LEPPDETPHVSLDVTDFPEKDAETTAAGIAADSGRSAHRHPVARFVARRLAAGLATLLVASALIFIATDALPGNVAQVVLGRYATPARVASLNQRLNLNQPILLRYGQWLGNAVTGNLGQSAVQVADGRGNAPVWPLIRTPLRNSAILAIATAILLIPLSLFAGTAAAVRAARPTDYTLSYTALIIGSLPEFVVGTFIIAIFFSWLNLFPPVSLVPPGTSPLSHISVLVLPILTLLAVSLAFCARQVRAGVLEALRQDYVRIARLSGMRERRVLFRYALRNALAPSVQTFAQAIQYLFGGIIVVESLFTYPGIGQLLVQSVSQRDFTMIQGITLVLAALYIFINIAADLLVVFLVPKLRTSLT
jgi:peptide/nickel transport system permease protein